MDVREILRAMRRRRRLLVAAGVAGALPAFALAGARAAGLVQVSWGVALAPFTAVGAAAAAVFLVRAVGPGVRRVSVVLLGRVPFRQRGTPPPARLEAPVDVTGRSGRVVTEHPEILAAVCHGLRRRKLVPTALGRPTVDPWGLYREALVRGDEGLEELRAAAARHTRRFRDKGRATAGRNLSESRVLKQAVRTFERCARKAEAGHNSPECTFEHLTVIYGVDLPSRDRHLKAAAPRVRRLLRLVYPELELTSPHGEGLDNPRELRREAVRARRELARLKKDNEQLEDALAEAEEALGKAKTERESLRRALETHRQRARAEAEAVRDEAQREAEAAIEAARAEQEREVKRLELDRRRVEERLEALREERDAFEHALLGMGEGDETEGNEVLHPFPAERLAGTRVLLVGGLDRQVPPIREHLERHGVQLLHEDSLAAAGMVDTVHVVVLWTRFLSHAIAEAVKRECRVRELPFLYWTRASPPSLARLLAEEVGGDEGDGGGRTAGGRETK